MTTTAPANHIACHLGDGFVRRGEAVVRSIGLEEVGFHTSCFTIYRAVKDVVADEVAREEIVGLTLAQRLARAGYQS